MLRSAWLVVAVAVGGGLAGVSLSYFVREPDLRAPASSPWFPDGVVDLGLVAQGSYHQVSTRFVNPLDHPVEVYGLYASCGCLSPDGDLGILLPGQSAGLMVGVQPRVSQGEFQEHVKLLIRGGDFPEAWVLIRGAVESLAQIVRPANFGEVVSEWGGYTELRFLAPGHASDFAGLTEIVFASGLRPPVELYAGAPTFETSQEENGPWVQASVGVTLQPSSFAGDLSGFWHVPLPDHAGGGTLAVPLRGTLTSLISVEPSPILRWSGTTATAVLRASALTQVEGIHFPEMGECSGVEWRIGAREGASAYGTWFWLQRRENSSRAKSATSPSKSLASGWS